MRFLRKVVRRERRRLHPFDVPEMKVLVAHQTEKRPIFVGDAFITAGGQVIPGADKRRRPAMFKTAIAAARCIKKKQVAIQILRRTQK